ncbi:hypothetical protein BKA62DRAFT_293475 [Auriculariales sp. MPI-PUGE-AT-0066]|nr:hypothetical protein BKA62DRAFT_293475 [Auriculariales sp. MPI-PUGE-AT-0066]
MHARSLCLYSSTKRLPRLNGIPYCTMTAVLKLGDTYRLSQPIGEGSILIQSNSVNSTPEPSVQLDTTAFNFDDANGDHILHISIRRVEDSIVFNTKSGANWGREERIKFSNVFHYRYSFIILQVHSDKIDVIVDGSVVKTFQKRTHKDIATVQYYSSGPSVLSDELQVSSMTGVNPPDKIPLYLYKEIDFGRPIGDGGSVQFYSNTVNLVSDFSNYIDNTSINIESSDGDTLLHVSVRRVENAIVFNSLSKGGEWGTEERVALLGVFERTDATFTVRLNGAEWHILVDGRPIKTYHQRIHKPAVTASYRSNNRPVFSDPLLVTVATKDQPVPPASRPSAPSYERAYFPLKPADVAAESEKEPLDYIIIGSGIGGGVLAVDLLEKNKRLSGRNASFTSQSTNKPSADTVLRTATVATASVDESEENPSATTILDPNDKSKRILVVEAGGLLFNTHSLNTARPTDRGTYGQMNDLFYNHFKTQWDMDKETADIWKGGAVYCLGGRSTVWGLFSPRIADDTLRDHFPRSVHASLNSNTYLRRAEEMMNVSYPHTEPLHRTVIDQLNIHDRRSGLPTTAWEWGRIASQFSDKRNYDFAEGAYATTDRLLEAAMDDHRGDSKFKMLLNSPVDRLEPVPKAGETTPVTHVVVKDQNGGEHRIRANNVVVSAGTIDSAAIFLRSAQGPLANAFGRDFDRDFGHVTDHYIFYVTLPFFYRNMAKKDIIGGMKLQTDISFSTLDNTTALANISIDAAGFLPRRNVPDSQLPQFIIAYILPSSLAPRNYVELNDKGAPRIHVGYAPDPRLEDKKNILIDFAADVMNKIALVLEVQFVLHPHEKADYTPLDTITSKLIKEKQLFGELGPGGVAHEMGSLPMPTPGPNGTDTGGLVDANLKLKYGWDNVYCCDLGVFPYSPAANPTLSLAALSLRLSDHLVPPDSTRYQPITVVNLLSAPVFVSMSLSDQDAPNFGPPPMERVRIETGKSALWRRQNKETISVYACECARSFHLQMVYPGVNALIVTEPPQKASCQCK